jgi:hypothetical protein
MRSLLTRIFGKPQIIGGMDGDSPTYLCRWFVIPKFNKNGVRRPFSVYLHNFNRSDDDRALHDHPFWNCSILLKGCYLEHMPGGVVKKRYPFLPVFRPASAAHRIELIDGKSVWTLFLTGRKTREWGFYCPVRWKHWTMFEHDNGCGEDLNMPEIDLRRIEVRYTNGDADTFLATQTEAEKVFDNIAEEAFEFVHTRGRTVIFSRDVSRVTIGLNQ